MHIGYFDEFGHNGAYVNGYDVHFKPHPVFAIGRFIIPAQNVRRLSGSFKHLKETGLRAEIEAKVRAKGKKVEHWEKKGAALLTTRNARKYSELRRLNESAEKLLEPLFLHFQQARQDQSQWRWQGHVLQPSRKEEKVLFSYIHAGFKSRPAWRLVLWNSSRVLQRLSSDHLRN